ncbi:polysaccharide pyruvyl transferase family protein [Psychroflexus salinarum]|uniref:Polysaccharide pyruvyl transferase family protein n=1 Tax=Psychroflexus salinarum TaxID=546024 RepID=A0ABW3GSB3_9FLAO
MKIFVIGQTTMEMYRIEYGNIGNYYILEPFFRKLHEYFPNSIIKTTLQLTDRFCKAEKVSSVPMELYYDLNSAQNEKDVDEEVSLAKKIKQGAEIEEDSLTPYLRQVLESDLVIDFSGDIWGENASLLKKDRFIVGVKKNQVAQELGKFTAFIASSPGPFDVDDNFELAKQVFENFNFVGNRESESLKVLENFNINTEKVGSYACPAFLFEPETLKSVVKERYFLEDKKTLGFILCGFNFEEGPHNKWPREASDYSKFVELVSNFLTKNPDYQVIFMSHANGFKLPPTPFVQIPGSDFKHAKMMFDLLSKKGFKNQIKLLDEILSQHQTKGFIANFDLLISGRIHGAVAGFSQNIPTMVLDYGHDPKAHKTLGFVKNIGSEAYFCDPNDLKVMKTKLDELNLSRLEESYRLDTANKFVKDKIDKMFFDFKITYENY